MDPATMKAAKIGVKKSVVASSSTDPSPISGGSKIIAANGQQLDLNDLPKAKLQFAKIKAQALVDGNYNGKSLKYLGGGRSAMLYTDLRTQGIEHDAAKRLVGERFQDSVKKIMADGNPSQKAELHTFLDKNPGLKTVPASTTPAAESN